MTSFLNFGLEERSDVLEQVMADLRAGDPEHIRRLQMENNFFSLL